MSEQLIEQGWKCRELPGFMGHAGPLWVRREGETWAYGLVADSKHLNPAGLVHGGALLTLLDHAISTVAWEACERQPCLTLQLDTHFIRPVQQGQFVVVRPWVLRKATDILFMRADLYVDENRVLSTQALMKPVSSARVVEPRG